MLDYDNIQPLTVQELIEWAVNDMAGAIPPPNAHGRPWKSGPVPASSPRNPVSGRKLATLMVWSEAHAMNVLNGNMRITLDTTLKCRDLAILKRIADGKSPLASDRLFAMWRLAKEHVPGARNTPFQVAVRAKDRTVLAKVADGKRIAAADRSYCKWRIYSDDYGDSTGPELAEADAAQPA